MNDVDLQLLRDFLRTLQDSGVQHFSGYGVTVSFPATPTHIPVATEILPLPTEPKEDFRSAILKAHKSGTSVWEDPSLWPAQGGKRLRFDGKIE